MIIYDDDGVGRNVVPMKVIEDIKAEMHARTKKNENGKFYLWEEWIDEIIDRHIKERRKIDD